MSKCKTSMIARGRVTATMAIARTAVAGMAVAALLAVAGPAAARPRPLLFAQAETVVEPAAPAQRDQLFPAQRGVTLAQATAMAQNRYQGRVVRAETVQMGERSVHEIRILGEDGRVRTVRIDAQTGSFL